MIKRFGRWVGRFIAQEPDTDPEAFVEREIAVTSGFAYGGSDIGRQRKNNEDAFLCNTELGLFAVCDGMGGMAAGQEASAEAISYLGGYLTGQRLSAAVLEGKDAVEKLMVSALVGASDAILSVVESHPDWAGMGSTAVIGLLADERLYVTNLGDSRAYLLRDQAIELLTQDHSVAAALVASGDLTPEEGRKHHLRNRLTACLGSEEFRPPHFREVLVKAGDRLVLCSDGLWDMLPDEEIGRIVLAAKTTSNTVSSLIKAANRAGGADNITAVVIHITDSVLTGLTHGSDAVAAAQPDLPSSDGTEVAETDTISGTWEVPPDAQQP
jgi:protein phosphatase